MSKAIRTAKEIIEDHLNLSKKGTIEEDLKHNYAEDVILLTSYGIYKGHDGVKELMEMLNKELPDASFDYKKILVDGDIAFLEWSGDSKNTKIEDGADSYIVRNGRIIAQTIHYTITPKNE
jgi:hypothetical protein